MNIVNAHAVQSCFLAFLPASEALSPPWKMSTARRTWKRTRRMCSRAEMMKPSKLAGNEDSDSTDSGNEGLFLKSNLTHFKSYRYLLFIKSFITVSLSLV